MILAGGEGKRMGPLTVDRAKPAVPFGGRYRVIDIILSNFVNSGLFRIKILTQYKSASLEEHIARGVAALVDARQLHRDHPRAAAHRQELVPRLGRRGVPDAARHHRREPRITSASSAATTSSRWTSARCSRFTSQRDADLTVAAIPVPREEARAFGVIECDEDGRIVAFHEKPENPPPMPGHPISRSHRWATTSSRPSALIEELERDVTNEASNHDFGRDVVPRLVRAGRRVFVYDFATNGVPGESERERGYWRDIGTVEAYWEAQMDLVEIHRMFNLYNQRWPIRTGMSHDPPAKFVFRDEAHARVGVATDSLVSDGCIISGGRIHRSVLSPRVRINSFSEVEESILFENVEYRSLRAHPPLHHRQRRRHPAGHLDRLRPRRRCRRSS